VIAYGKIGRIGSQVTLPLPSLPQRRLRDGRGRVASARAASSINGRDGPGASQLNNGPGVDGGPLPSYFEQYMRLPSELRENTRR